MREGKHINKSLFFLTQVISMKSEGGRDHIPFRNSPLTKILRTSLGGNSRTSIILCVTPAVSQYEQTMSTLRFGQSAKKIQNRIHANVTEGQDEENLRRLISEYQKKLEDFEEDKQRSSKLMQVIEDLEE